MGKDRGIMLKDVGEGSDTVEEKIRRLPVGGEMWDRKMKRKRSVGTASMRPIDGDVEPKRVMHHKYKNEPAQQSSDAQRFRYKHFLFWCRDAICFQIFSSVVILFNNGNGIQEDQEQ